MFGGGIFGVETKNSIPCESFSLKDVEMPSLLNGIGFVIALKLVHGKN